MEHVSQALVEMAEATKGLRPPKPELLTNCPGAQVRPVMTYPRDARTLRLDTLEVEHFDPALRDRVGSMAMTMYAQGAVGIAAPQLGWNLRIFVTDILSAAPAQEGRPLSQLLVAVNPTVWPLPGRTHRDAERCLSFPGAVELVTRPAQVTMRAYSLSGEPYALGCGGNLARVIQHEYDHLQGVLMLDRLDEKGARQLKRRMWEERTKH